MAFSVPSLADVSRTIENGFSSAFYGTSGNLRVGVLKVLSKVIAGGCYLPILFCNYIFRNSFIDSADAENLVRFGGWYNLPHKVASPARGEIKVEFSKATTIPNGTIILDPNTDDEYEIIESVTCTKASVYSVKVVAVEVGSQGNRLTAGSVTFAFRDGDIDGVDNMTNYPLDGGASYDVSVNGITEQWGEDVESYRKRLKERRQHQPNGGSDNDYKMWAERFTQVSDAFVFGNWPNTNSVTIFCSNYNSGVSVTSTDLAEVSEYIKSDVRKPITADVHVVSVDPVKVGMTIRTDSTSDATRQNIADCLADKLKGFGLGDTLTRATIQQILIENGICSSCTITQLLVNGSDVTTAGYAFVKDYSSGIFTGEVVNTTLLADNITLVA